MDSTDIPSRSLHLESLSPTRAMTAFPLPSGSKGSTDILERQSTLCGSILLSAYA